MEPRLHNLDRKAARQIAIAEAPGQLGEIIGRVRLHHLRAHPVIACHRDRHTDDAEQFRKVAPARGYLQRHVLDIGQARQCSGHIDMVVGGVGGQHELVLPTRHGRIGGEQRAAERERRIADLPGSGKAHRRADLRIARRDRVKGQIGAQPHLRIAIAQRRASHRGQVDSRQIERFAAGRRPERPAILGVRLVPFEIDRAVDQIERVETPLAENHR